MFYDPRGVYRGRDEIIESRGRSGRPIRTSNTRPRPNRRSCITPVASMGSGRPGEAPAYAGTDFIIARDGRIAALYLFFDPLVT